MYENAAPMGGMSIVRRAARLAVVLAVLLAPAARASHSELAVRLPLDELKADHTTPDASGHGFDGSGYGVELTANASRFGRGLIFDGSTSYVTQVRDATLEPERVTVLAWVNGRGDPGQSNRYVIAKGATGCSASSWALYTGASAGLSFHVWQSPGADPDMWQDGNWHAVAGTFDGSTVRLYVDGSEVGAGTAVPAGTPIAYALPKRDFMQGNYPNAGSCPGVGPWYGALDEVRVYNRALTPAEVQRLQDPNATEPPQLDAPSGPAAAPAASSHRRPRSRRSRSSPRRGRSRSGARAGSARPARSRRAGRRSSATSGTSTRTAGSRPTAGRPPPPCRTRSGRRARRPSDCGSPTPRA
jgi:hypothetical protein